jgi:hypothetical protein
LELLKKMRGDVVALFYHILRREARWPKYWL